MAHLFMATRYLPSGLTVSPSAAAMWPTLYCTGVFVTSVQSSSSCRSAEIAAQRPASHGRLQEQAGVGIALVVKLRVQRAQAHFDLRFHDVIEVQHRHAVLVGLKVAGGDGVLDLLEAVNGHVRVQLAGDDHVLAVRGHVHTVRALGFRGEVEQPFGNGGLQRDDREAVHIHRLAGRGHFDGLVQVDDVHVIHITL